jgi:peroxiredoxin
MPSLRLLTLSASFALILGAQAVDVRQMGNRAGKFKAGDMAPDFTLKVMHKQTEVTLSSFRDKRPVVLVFGSYT